MHKRNFPIARYTYSFLACLLAVGDGVLAQETADAYLDRSRYLIVEDDSPLRSLDEMQSMRREYAKLIAAGDCDAALPLIVAFHEAANLAANILNQGLKPWRDAEGYERGEIANRGPGPEMRLAEDRAIELERQRNAAWVEEAKCLLETGRRSAAIARLYQALDFIDAAEASWPLWEEARRLLWAEVGYPSPDVSGRLTSGVSEWAAEYSGDSESQLEAASDGPAVSDRVTLPAEQGNKNVVVFATRPSWVRVTAADGSTLFEKIMDSGEGWALPRTEMPPRLHTGNAGAIYFAVNGEVYGPAGEDRFVVRELALDADDLRSIFEPASDLQDINVDAIIRVAIGDRTGSQRGLNQSGRDEAAPAPVRPVNYRQEIRQYVAIPCYRNIVRSQGVARGLSEDENVRLLMDMQRGELEELTRRVTREVRGLDQRARQAKYREYSTVCGQRVR